MENYLFNTEVGHLIIECFGYFIIAIFAYAVCVGIALTRKDHDH